MAELTLPAEQAKALVASEKQIAAAERAIAEYESHGLDASAQKAVVAEAKRLRASILAQHSPYNVKRK